jgi:hypothetical protein
MATAPKRRRRRKNIVGKAKATKPGKEEKGVVVSKERGGSFYEVDRVVGKRKKGRGWQFKIRWKNCSPEEDTWEPAKNLCDTAYEEAMAFFEGEEEEFDQGKDSKGVDDKNGTPQKTEIVEDEDDERSIEDVEMAEMVEDEDEEGTTKEVEKAEMVEHEDEEGITKDAVIDSGRRKKTASKSVFIESGISKNSSTGGGSF